jgi:hypothetical protein
MPFDKRRNRVEGSVGKIGAIQKMLRIVKLRCTNGKKEREKAGWSAHRLRRPVKFERSHTIRERNVSPLFLWYIVPSNDRVHCWRSWNDHGASWRSETFCFCQIYISQYRIVYFCYPASLMLGLIVNWTDPILRARCDTVRNTSANKGHPEFWTVTFPHFFRGLSSPLTVASAADDHGGSGRSWTFCFCMFYISQYRIDYIAILHQWDSA